MLFAGLYDIPFGVSVPIPVMLPNEVTAPVIGSTSHKVGGGPTSVK